MKSICLALLVLLPLAASQTAVSQCKGLPAPNAVWLNNCGTPPCDLVRGTNGTTLIQFTPQQEASFFRPTVKGTYLGISQSHDLGENGKNGCGFLVEGECPLTPGRTVTHRIVDEVKKNEQKVKGVKLTYNILKDGTKDILACFEVKVNIVDL